jgi:hypothetical protein
VIWWLEAWAAVVGISLIIGAAWLWLERKYPPHSHNEGGYVPHRRGDIEHCPGCFAEKALAPYAIPRVEDLLDEETRRWWHNGRPVDGEQRLIDEKFDEIMRGLR